MLGKNNGHIYVLNKNHVFKEIEIIVIKKNVNKMSTLITLVVEANWWIQIKNYVLIVNEIDQNYKKTFCSITKTSQYFCQMSKPTIVNDYNTIYDVKKMFHLTHFLGMYFA